MTTEEMEILAKRHMESVFQFCCFLTGSRSEAEDLCQDTFLKAIELEKKIDCINEDREMKNYLIGIAVNLWKNHRRKKSWRQRIAPSSSFDEIAQQMLCTEQNIEDEMLKKEMVNEVRVAVERLPDKQKIVINLYYSAEMNMEEVAKVLHIPRETVKSRLRLAKGKIRKSLEVLGYEI